MNRPTWLAAIVVVLAPASVLAQQGMGMQGGMGGGGMMRGGMGGMGMGGMGGMGMGGMGGMGMGGMGGMMMGGGAAAVARPVQVEIEGGRRLSGRISLGPLNVDGDLGAYWVRPDRIKTIRFSRPAHAAKPGPANRQQGDNAPNAGAGGDNPGDQEAIVEGKLVTTSNQEITGEIHLPPVFRLQLDFGWLNLPAEQLRTMTFTAASADAERTGELAGPRTGAAAAREHDEPARAEPDEPAIAPMYERAGNSLIVSVPGDNRVAFCNLETGMTRTIELSPSKDAPVGVTAIRGAEIMALHLSGPRITRIAVVDLENATLQPQDLREPVEGNAGPLVAPGIAVYTLGRHVYAYSTRAHRWDVADLPEPLSPQQGPIVGADGGTTIASRGHVYAFVPKTGKWEHIDVRKVLGAGQKP